MEDRHLLTRKEIAWAYDKWCAGYTYEEIAEALYCSAKTVYRALKGREKIKPVSVYEE